MLNFFLAFETKICQAVFEGAFGGARSAYAIAVRKLDADEGKGTWDAAAERAKLRESLTALETSLVSFSDAGIHM